MTGTKPAEWGALKVPVPTDRRVEPQFAAFRGRRVRSERDRPCTGARRGRGSEATSMEKAVQALQAEMEEMRSELQIARAEAAQAAGLASEVDALRAQLRMVRDEMSFFVKRHELADGSSYVGGYERGKANGQGRRTWPNGDIYEGNFKDGVMEGYGILTWHDGSRYEGDWAAGKRHGRGDYKTPEGDHYAGMWKDDKRHGKGKQIESGGDMYNGEWVNDLREGKGTYKSADGDSYNGLWRADKMNGHGTYTWADGGQVRSHPLSLTPAHSSQPASRPSFAPGPLVLYAAAASLSFASPRCCVCTVHGSVDERRARRAGCVSLLPCGLNRSLRGEV